MELWEAARALVGTPWLEAGCTERGVDCAHFVPLACRRMGVEIDPENRLSRNRNWKSSWRLVSRYFEMQPVRDARPGDVVAIGGRAVEYIGVLSPAGKLIGIAEKRAVAEELTFPGSYTVIGVFRLCRSS